MAEKEDRSITLLRAACQMLHSVMNQYDISKTVFYDGTLCDIRCLVNDISDYLLDTGQKDINPDELEVYKTFDKLSKEHSLEKDDLIYLIRQWEIVKSLGMMDD